MPTAPAILGVNVRPAVSADRGTSAARGYGHKWRIARGQYLRRNPICACGCERPATEVDHIVPHRGDDDLFWNVANWQGLTKACHSAKTGRGS